MGQAENDLVPAPSSWFETEATAQDAEDMKAINSETKSSRDTTDEVRKTTHEMDNTGAVRTADKLRPASSNKTTIRLDLLQNQYFANPHSSKMNVSGRSVPGPFLRQEEQEEKDENSTIGKSSRQVGVPSPSPSWKELSSQVLPAAARELLSSSFHRICHTGRLSYAITTTWQVQYRELGNPSRGYFRTTAESENLPPFSSLPWVERQMVEEWRTFHQSETARAPTITAIQQEEQFLAQQRKRHYDGPEDDSASVFTLGSCFDDEIDEDGDDICDEHKTIFEDDDKNIAEEDDDEVEFSLARTLVPATMERPVWQHSEVCNACYKPFGPTRLRHHCRMCGSSFCQTHSSNLHPLPHLGYQVPERVCDECKQKLNEHDLAERVAWRVARCRDYRENSLCPYFELGVDTIHDIAMRVTNAAIAMAKSIPLGAQASVAVETIEVLRKHGLNGIYSILLRQEFLSAANMLQKALGINRTSWPLSVHELSAAIFYALAQHRALRGLNPEYEHEIHAIRPQKIANNQSEITTSSAGEQVTHTETSSGPLKIESSSEREFTPVCDAVPDSTIDALVFFAPLALNFIYAEKEVEMQLLAAQQGWRLLYAHLHQDGPQRETKLHDRPASAVFVHKTHKIACLAIRGTATIHDVITDIRHTPVPFPEPDVRKTASDGEWTSVSSAPGLAVSGMASAAMNLYREHMDSLLYLANEGYQIRLVGHSLGGGVASLLGALLHHDAPHITSTASNKDPSTLRGLRVYSYGTPACVDARLSDIVEPFVIAAVLHDDVVPRLSSSSCRGLLKHLLHIRDTWVKEHLPDDIMAITERARLAWAPRWREGFTLLPSGPSSSSIKRYCRRQYQNGKKQLMSMKKILLQVADDQFGHVAKDVDTGKNILDKDSERGTEVSFSVETEGKDVSTSLTYEASEHSWRSEANSEPCLLVDYLGEAGPSNNPSGIVVDGDEFFEADGEELLESEEEDQFEDAVQDLMKQQEEEKTIAARLRQDQESDKESDESTALDEETPEAVVLAETPLPRLYIPGKIIHIYAHRGCYRAVYVPRSFRELRRISMAGNMLMDHTSKAYYEALLEVRTVRAASENAPQWASFDEDNKCSCCASRFTWASTSDSAAQEARDKHNCRSCGALVCDPCSSNRIPLPSIGLTAAARVCDRCYNNIDGIMNIPLQEDESNAQDRRMNDADKKPERRRESLSVVDELAVNGLKQPSL